MMINKIVDDINPDALKDSIAEYYLKAGFFCFFWPVLISAFFTTGVVVWWLIGLVLGIA